MYMNGKMLDLTESGKRPKHQMRKTVSVSDGKNRRDESGNRLGGIAGITVCNFSLNESF